MSTVAVAATSGSAAPLIVRNKQDLVFRMDGGRLLSGSHQGHQEWGFSQRSNWTLRKGTRAVTFGGQIGKNGTTRKFEACMGRFSETKVRLRPEAVRNTAWNQANGVKKLPSKIVQQPPPSSHISRARATTDTTRDTLA